MGFLGLVPALSSCIILPLLSKRVKPALLTALEGVSVKELKHLLGEVDNLVFLLLRVLGVSLEPGMRNVLLEPVSSYS